MYALQEVRESSQRARFVGIKSTRYNLRQSENNDGTGGVAILVKEELCEKVVEVPRKSDTMMTMALVSRRKL